MTRGPVSGPRGVCYAGRLPAKEVPVQDVVDALPETVADYWLTTHASSLRGRDSL